MGVWVGGWLYISVYISFYTYIHIHFFFINLIVKSIETFVVCAVSRIKLLLLLLLLSNTAAYMSANVILLFSSPSGNWNVLKTLMASSPANFRNIAILIESSFFSLPKAVKYI